MKNKRMNKNNLLQLDTFGTLVVAYTQDLLGLVHDAFQLDVCDYTYLQTKETKYNRLIDM